MSVDKKKNVLFIITSHDELGATGKKTGWYLPEVAHPWLILKKAGFKITVATPKGGKPPMDPTSGEMFAGDKECNEWLADSEAQKIINNSITLDKVKPEEYGVLIYPGGHGPMWDLATDAKSISLATKIYEQGGYIGAVCHGTAALVNVKLSNGTYLLANKKATGFSNAEEDAVGLSQYMPFMLETAIKEVSGGVYSKAEGLWGAHVTIDGRIITGQNPSSAGPMAEAFVKALA
ncbi:hypothetical protein HDU76_000479 [Blyttiomyces sp. JEL0837]|nr:hypothetical protein HDU76_000479 [Blyttiomyces sp. JEL0837]